MSNIKNIRLALEDGLEVKGYSFGYEGSSAGEVVFNTAMTGYPESLTDPSYKGQILILTYPLIGNYGVPPVEYENNLIQNFESNAIHISGLVISDYSYDSSHWKSQMSLSDWLVRNKIPAIHGVDTRMLTKRIRERGALLGKIIYEKNDILLHDPNQENLVAMVSTSEKVVYGNGRYRILLVDCGVKYNIIRRLLMRDTTVIRVPWDYDFTKEEYDGLFISNGPGDPVKCGTTINHLSEEIKKDKPVFGICLGNQLLALAAGGKTYKMKQLSGFKTYSKTKAKYRNGRVYVIKNYNWQPVAQRCYFTDYHIFDYSNDTIVMEKIYDRNDSLAFETKFVFDKYGNVLETRSLSRKRATGWGIDVTHYSYDANQTDRCIFNYKFDKGNS